MKNVFLLIGFLSLGVWVFGQDKLAYLEINETNSTEVTLKGTLFELVENEKVALPFANVTVEGTTDFTFTNIDGSFELITNQKGGTLKFTFKGYESVVVPIDNNKGFNVVLKKEFDNCKVSAVVEGKI